MSDTLQPTNYAHARFVQLKKFEELTGYTVKACEQKIARGVWLQGREYRRAPDGRLLVDMAGYERWVMNPP